MIISHKYKFIFLKTNKTAGTSVEIALSKFCGTDDIITPICLRDEKIRGELGYPAPQNHTSSIWGYTLADIFKIIYKRRKKIRFYNHIPAKKVRAYIGKEVWDSYYKFCIERNPWDRVVSLYYWRHRRESEPLPAISEFVNSKDPKILKKRGRRVYTINGKIAVDKICKFENLANDLEEVRKHVGIPEKLELPRAKTGFRKDKRNYREILSETDREKVARLFHEEIDLLGYEW
jgi:hypothetical protein